MNNILQTIIQTKYQEIEQKLQSKSLEQMQGLAEACELPLRPFREAMNQQILQQKPTIIAELKKASPSKGVIREDFDLFVLAQAYAKANATCLSVLTDQQYFQGHDRFLREVRETVDLPLLRKDFIVEPYQVYESRVLGADAILLIAAALTPEKVEQLSQLAHSLGLDVLIEVHSLEEHKAIRHLSETCLIGVNNRNLKTFEVDTQITLDIHHALSDSLWCITESGIHERAQVETMLQAGVYGFLIGEAFMRYPDPAQGIAALFPEL